MEHIHNEAVLAFFKAHEDHPNVQRFLEKQKREIEAMNKSLGTDYRGYLVYLEGNIGDDADWSMEELKALLRPRFEVKLFKKEQSDYECDGFDISLDELLKPVYIKDEGDFFTVWGKDGRVDIPARLLKRFVVFLEENGVTYKSEYDL